MYAGVAHYRVFAAQFLLNIKEFIYYAVRKERPFSRGPVLRNLLGGFLRILARTFSSMWRKKLR